MTKKDKPEPTPESAEERALRARLDREFGPEMSMSPRRRQLIGLAAIVAFFAIILLAFLVA